MKRLETTILKNLIKDKDYASKVLPFLSKEYFTNQTDKNVFNEIVDFVGTYKNIPTYEALVINFTEKKNLTAKEVSDAVEFINTLKIDKDETDQKWLIDQTEKFCQDKAIYNAIMESVSILDETNQANKKSKGEIPKLLSDALSVTFDNNIGHDYISDYEDRYESYHKVDARVKTDLDLLNKITRGGFPVKTLNVFMAGTGVGKSLMMCHLSAACIAQGYNVLYITMEMAEEKIAERIDANLLNVDLVDLHTLSKNDYVRKFDKLKTKTHGKLIIKEYPTASASSLHFRALLNDLELKKSFKPDIIFIDYLNICSSSRIKQGGGVNSYTYIKSIAEELRGLAVEQNVPIISATQTNRSGYDNTDVDLTNTSESFGLPATVDWMVALMSSEELESTNKLMIKQLKNRYADPNYYKRFVVGVDRAKMKLYDVEEFAQNNIADSGQDDKPINTFGGNDRKFNKNFEGLKV